jgi:HEAT repeat protein
MLKSKWVWIVMIANGMALLSNTMAFGQSSTAASTPVASERTIAQWVVLAKGPDEDVRRQAVYALGRMGAAAKEAVPALVVAMDDVKQEVRWYAVDALGSIGPDAADAAPAIVVAIKDPANDRTFARNALKALGRIGPVIGDEAKQQVRLLLAEALKSNDASYQAAAALALWKIERHPAAMTALGQLLRQPSGGGAFEACAALLEMGDDAKPAATDIVTVLAHQDPDARRAAAKLLGAMGPPVIPLIAKSLADSPAIDRESAAVALAIIVDDVREKSLYDSATAPSQFAAAAKPLLEQVLPSMLPLLGDERENVRQAATGTLARMGSLAVPSLLTALKNPDERVRQSARDALVRLERYLPNASPAPPAVELLKRQLVQPLITVLGEADKQVRHPALRIFAALAIGEEGRDAIPLLREALKENDAVVRRHAARALERLQDKP